jgi:cystathionine beta-synthase
MTFPTNGKNDVHRNISSSTISDWIGNTPLVELPLPLHCARLSLKLEQFNPTGSMKVRMARKMIEDALASGRLRPGGRIVESTSGNTGCGIAMIAAQKGLKFTAIVDAHASTDKLKVMRAFGAELIFVTDSTNETPNTAARDALAQRLAEDNEDTFWTAQHNNPSNPSAYDILAAELMEQLGGKIDILVGAVGTGGSLCGTARALRQKLPDLHVVGVEPVGSVIFGGPGGPYFQSGTGTPLGAEIGKVVDYSLIHEGTKVSDMEAFVTARWLARSHGLLIGGSGGGVVYRAACTARRYGSHIRVVALIADGGEKYLDTVYDDNWMEKHGFLNAEGVAGIMQVLEVPKVTYANFCTTAKRKYATGRG